MLFWNGFIVYNGRKEKQLEYLAGDSHHLLLFFSPFSPICNLVLENGLDIMLINC